MTDYEYSRFVRVYDSHIEDTITVHVSVSKVGGGTVGNTYTGHWDVAVTLDGQDTITDVLTTAMPKTHREAAIVAADIVVNRFEE